MSVSHTALSYTFPVFISASLFLSLSAAPRVYSYEHNQAAAAAAAAGAPSLNCTFSTVCRNSLESLLVALTTNYHLPCHDLQRFFQSLSLSLSLSRQSLGFSRQHGWCDRKSCCARKEGGGRAILLCPGKQGFPVQDKGTRRRAYPGP